MTRKEYDKIVDVFAFLAPHIEKTRDENWPMYQEDEPKHLVVELSISLGITVGAEVCMGDKNPFTDRDGLACFSPEELN